MTATDRGELAPSKTVQSIPRSGIRAIMDLAWSTPDVIHLEVGEPNFPTPPHIVAAAGEAAEAGQTKYTPNAGVPELRAALADKVTTRNGYPVEAEQVIITTGAVEGLYSSLLSLVDPGDEVLLPDPGWPNFEMMARLLRAQPRRYPLTPEGDYLPEVADLERLVGPRTRALVLNSPSNPLGAIIPGERLRELCDFAADHGIWVVSDECYDAIVFDPGFTSAGAVGGSDRVISVYSFSKTYAMTGWRVGYAVVPPPLAEVLSKLQEPLISCVNAPAQAAALAAVTGPQDEVEHMRTSYAGRRDEVLGVLADGGLPAFRPSGAFYVWVDVTASGMDSMTFARMLIERHGVAVVPGSAFGPSGEGAVRISLATSLDLLLEGARRMTELVAERA